MAIFTIPRRVSAWLKPSMEPFPLPKLPGELRQQIWDLLLPPAEGIKLDLSDDVPKLMDNLLAITSVCRQTHQDCGDLQHFWEKNDFIIPTHHFRRSMTSGSGYVEDTNSSHRMLNKLEQLLLALPPGFAARGQNLQIHLGAWNTSTTKSQDSSHGLFKDIASTLKIITGVLGIQPLVSIDLVWHYGRSHFDFGTVILSLWDAEQVRVNARAAIRKKNKELGRARVGRYMAQVRG